MENGHRHPAIRLSPEEHRQFLISHLHRIYCAKSELAEKLPEIGKRAHFLDLQQAVAETVDVIRLQLRRMKDIYILLHSHYRRESCIGLVGVLDEAFQSIGTPGESAVLQDLSILFYMQHIESIEMASFKTMLMVATDLEPEVEQLLRECYDEACEEKALYTAIMSNYLS